MYGAGGRHFKLEECTGDRHYTNSGFVYINTVNWFFRPIYCRGISHWQALQMRGMYRGQTLHYTHKSNLGFSPIVTTKHNVMKCMENDDYFILFIRHFPCPSPIECIHQHPIKWIHQCICTQRDITRHWSQGEIL